MENVDKFSKIGISGYSELLDQCNFRDELLFLKCRLKLIHLGVVKDNVYE